MKNVVGQMMTQRIQPPDSIIQGVGYPGERVPVAQVKIQKSPFEERWIQRADIGILKNVSLIIPVNICIPQRCEIDEKGYQGN
jgi:hypothetical protein